MSQPELWVLTVVDCESETDAADLYRYSKVPENRFLVITTCPPEERLDVPGTLVHVHSGTREATLWNVGLDLIRRHQLRAGVEQWDILLARPGARVARFVTDSMRASMRQFGVGMAEIDPNPTDAPELSTSFEVEPNDTAPYLLTVAGEESPRFDALYRSPEDAWSEFCFRVRATSGAVKVSTGPMVAIA